MEFHKFSDIFPMMKDEEFNELKADINEHGLIEPILTYNGQIIDGRNRYQACKISGIKPIFKEWNGNGSIIDLILSLNLKRRHLTPSQKAAIAVDLLPHLEAEAKQRQLATLKQGTQVPVKAKMPEREEGGQARDHAARLMGVSPRYVSDAKAIEQKSIDDFLSVKSGEKTITQVIREQQRDNVTRKVKEFPSS